MAGTAKAWKRFREHREQYYKIEVCTQHSVNLGLSVSLR
jgi:hypothetical protein